MEKSVTGREMSTCKDTATQKALVALGNSEKLGVREEDMGNVLDRQADQVSRAGRSYGLGCSNGTGGGEMAMRRLDRRKEG